MIEITNQALVKGFVKLLKESLKLKTLLKLEIPLISSTPILTKNPDLSVGWILASVKLLSEEINIKKAKKDSILNLSINEQSFVTIDNLNSAYRMKVPDIGVVNYDLLKYILKSKGFSSISIDIDNQSIIFNDLKLPEDSFNAINQIVNNIDIPNNDEDTDEDTPTSKNIIEVESIVINWESPNNDTDVLSKVSLAETVSRRYSHEEFLSENTNDFNDIKMRSPFIAVNTRSPESSTYQIQKSNNGIIGDLLVSQDFVFFSVTLHFFYVE